MSFSQQKWQNFGSLNPAVVNSLKLAGFQKPTKIQQQVLRQYKNYYDFLIASQTGSGKTLAFALPILSEILEFHTNSALQKIPTALLGLIITPTRQLAQQIEGNIKQILQNISIPISVISIIGGMSKHRQLRIIKQKQPHIIIGTPGRIHEFLQDQVFNFEHLKYLVIDQADRIIELGHFKQVDQILWKIFKPKMKQFYEKDFLEITQAMVKKDKAQQSGLYLKQNGKKTRINFDLHTIQANKLFQVPFELFQFINQDGQNLTQQLPKIELKPKAQPVQIKVIDQPNLFRQLNQNQLYWLNKLKRRIFFVSATLTREFKGQKYAIKKKRQESDQIQKNNKSKKDRKNQKIFNKNKNKQDNRNNKNQQGKQQQNQIQSIPKLKALLSRVNFSAKPKIIDQSSQIFLPKGLVQRISFTDGQIQRITLLISYLKSLPHGSKIIIFSNTIKASKRIQFFIDSMDYKCSILHSHMEQKQRLTKLQRFKKSQVVNILISTDVAARGLDFTVNNVIQYGVPLNGDTYVHRAGRTARANRTGQALIIVDRAQGGKWCQINETLNASVQNRKIEKYIPSKMIMDEIQNKIKQYEWIRVNNERQKDVRNLQIQQMQAQQLGVQVDEQAVRKKYDLDKEEQQIVRNDLKKKVQKIKKFTKKPQIIQSNTIRWKKNKLVLSPDQIMKLM